MGEKFDQIIGGKLAESGTIFTHSRDIAKLVDPTTDMVISDSIADSEKRWRK